MNSKTEKFVRTPLSQSSHISQTKCTHCGRIIGASANPDVLAIVEGTHQCLAMQMVDSRSRSSAS